MRPSTILRVAALLGGLAVALGAFAAHGMKAHYEPAQLATFETGVRYQMYHALALGLCAALGAAGWRTGAAAIAFLVGIALFSGSLYGLVWLDAKWLGPVTPLGGVAFLVGWLLLALARSGATDRSAAA
ncbi:MAG: hypothetical protein RL398_1385 [Planctomycetota bacterium]|jgi:uncharacterized membrane protein YgdD (TMEM256/DUF423 family)